MGQNLLNQGQAQVSGISESLMNDLTAQYDGKTLSGSQVKSAAVQLANRDDASIKVKIKNSGDTEAVEMKSETNKTITQVINEKLKGKDTVKYTGSVVNNNGSAEITFTAK